MSGILDRAVPEAVAGLNWTALLALPPFMRRIKVCSAASVQHEARTDPVDLFAARRLSPGKDLEQPAHGIASIGEGRAIQLLMTAR
ncbi:hypothetical protein CCR96_17230 [Halochromatium roseum]|nr:hypothetical protein [Halochromatium roseum]